MQKAHEGRALQQQEVTWENLLQLASESHWDGPACLSSDSIVECDLSMAEMICFFHRNVQN